MADRADSEASADCSIVHQPELAEPEGSNSRSGVGNDHPGDDINTKIILKIRQQPVSAHVYRFDERHTSAVDPMPIVQLITEGFDLTDKHQYCRHILSCLCTSTGAEDKQPMAPVVSNSFIGKVEHGAEGCFFSFPNLSFNSTGTFRLTFCLIIIDPARARELKFFPVVSKVTSEVFTVYSVKHFPGVQATTVLTKALMEERVVPPSKHDDYRSDGDLGDGKQDEGEAK